MINVGGTYNEDDMDTSCLLEILVSGAPEDACQALTTGLRLLSEQSGAVSFALCSLIRGV